MGCLLPIKYPLPENDPEYVEPSIGTPAYNELISVLSSKYNDSGVVVVVAL